MNNVLVLAVHPDDETLGCGGTLLKHKEHGDRIYWLIATDMREESEFAKSEILQRQKEIDIVAGLYGFDGVYNLDIPAMKVDQLSMIELVKKISKIFNTVKPNIIYLPFMADMHSDHRIMFQAAYSCTKTFRYPFIKKVVMMESISETEYAPALTETSFVPNYFVDITSFLDKKLDIIKTYKSEIGNHPFPRSIENITSLAIFRGATSGCKYAEGFMVLKEIW